MTQVTEPVTEYVDVGKTTKHITPNEKSTPLKPVRFDNVRKVNACSSLSSDVHTSKITTYIKSTLIHKG